MKQWWFSQMCAEHFKWNCFISHNTTLTYLTPTNVPSITYRSEAGPCLMFKHSLYWQDLHIPLYNTKLFGPMFKCPLHATTVWIYPWTCDSCFKHTLNVTNRKYSKVVAPAFKLKKNLTIAFSLPFLKPEPEEQYFQS